MLRIMSNLITVVAFKGNTVYRKCSCGETAHDASYVGFKGDEGTNLFVYKCRNCGELAKFRK